MSDGGNLVKKIQTPIIVVNFKAYSKAVGYLAVALAKKAERVSDETNVYIGVAPQVADIKAVADAVSIPVFAQHVDPIQAGSHTGCVLVDSIKEAGGVGTLINHYERQLKLSEIKVVIDITRKKELISIVCANDPHVSAAVAALTPDLIAIEPPDLIGTGIAVSQAKPGTITKAVRLIRKVNPKITILCGAGISHGRDVSAALKLGTDGVLVASSVVKAKDPLAVLYEFAKATR